MKKGEKTGACAVILTGHDRYAFNCFIPVSAANVLICLSRSSLVTDLRAAEKFEKSWLSSPEIAPVLEAAKVFYIEGFFLTHGTESIVEIVKKASEAGKVRCVSFRLTLYRTHCVI